MWARQEGVRSIRLVTGAYHMPRRLMEFHAAAPGIVRQREFVRDLARVLGRPAVLPTPAIALRLALGEKATLALDSRHIVPRAALQAGYEFRFPDLPGALADLV